MERVNGMPVRCVITKRVINARWSDGIFEPGRIIEWSDSDVELFKSQYPDCIQEIEMSEEDWINLLTKNALESSQRIHELEQLYGEEFHSKYRGVIPTIGEKVDGHGYCDGLSDAYHITKSLQQDVRKFEKQCIQHLFENNSSNTLK